MPTDIQDLDAYLAAATVEAEVFRLRPDYRALLIAVSGMEPGPSDDSTEKALQEAEASVKSKLASTSVNDLPHIAAWREAYNAFGAKPNKTRNSLEALTRRVEKGLPRVNRLTDLYNSISISHQIPFGGEDLDAYSGAPQLKIATGSEDFETTASGEKIAEHPPKGEVVWCDDVGVTCRMWNYRQGPRTALTDNTRNAVFILDGLEKGGCAEKELRSAGEALINGLKSWSPDLKVAMRILAASQSC